MPVKKGAQPKVAAYIPSELPAILKEYTDDAIKAQPVDVLAWSAAYFRAMVNGETKTNYSKHTELTPSLLRVLHKQLAPSKTVSISQLKNRWIGLALLPIQLDRLLKKGDFKDGSFEWMDFFAFTCFNIADDLTDAMRIVCECMSIHENGSILFSSFVPVYKHLGITLGYAKDEQVVNDRICCLEKAFVKKQDGYIRPANFKKGSFPSLDGL